jgi:hypothetical protein
LKKYRQDTKKKSVVNNVFQKEDQNEYNMRNQNKTIKKQNDKGERSSSGPPGLGTNSRGKIQRSKNDSANDQLGMKPPLSNNTGGMIGGYR